MVELSTFLEKTPPDKKLEPISNDDLLVVEVSVGVWIQKMANWTICFHAQFLCHRPLIFHALWGYNRLQELLLLSAILYPA